MALAGLMLLGLSWQFLVDAVIGADEWACDSASDKLVWLTWVVENFCDLLFLLIWLI